MEIIKNIEKNEDLASKPLHLSQSKLGLFLDCPRCFYLSTKLGVKRPSGFPFLLNNKVDRDVKRHFDRYRNLGTTPPELLERGLNYVPLKHPEISKWRSSFKGLDFLDEKSNIKVFGAIDDIFVDTETNVEFIVDVKATAKSKGVHTADEIHPAFQRQLDLYVWLAQQNGRLTSDTAYLYHCNSMDIPNEFARRLDFELNIIPYETNTDWIPQSLLEVRHCIEKRVAPEASDTCEVCGFVEQLFGSEFPLLNQAN